MLHVRKRRRTIVDEVEEEVMDEPTPAPAPALPSQTVVDILNDSDEEEEEEEEEEGGAG